ncbi:MAG: hypothetical protein KGD58_07830 [Candidatus Lokiarchaeota archaeon]|nr:hypothetical protein [Candidatus Lokiarchaeota archaeon]
MFIGRGVVIGTKDLISSSYFFLVIITFNINSLWNHYITEKQTTPMEEITTTAIKLGELAKNLKNKLLES